MVTLDVTHLLVPIGTLEGAKQTYRQLEGCLDPSVTELTIGHVIEHTDGYLDSASPEALELEAEEMFDYHESYFEDGPEIPGELRYRPDTVEEIVAAAEELAVSAIGLSTRQKSGLEQLLTENTSYRLVTESQHPVLAFSHGAND